MYNVSISSSATSALRSLKDINSSLDATQNRISTGYKINSAKDNASIWQAATSLRSELKSYDASSDALTNAKNVYDTSASSASIVADLLGQLKTAIASGVTTTASTTERAEADANVLALQNQIKAVIADAKVQGVNLLDGGTAPTQTTSFASNTAPTTASFTALDFDTTTLGTTDANNFGTSSSILSTTITLVLGATNGASGAAGALDTAITAVSNYATKLAGAAARISSTQDIMSKITEAKKTALSNLVDADMEEESARLSALQVKQQLATQALSIANQSSQNILRLFQ